MTDEIDRIADTLAAEVVDRFAEATASAVASRLEPRRCPHCSAPVYLERDPLTSCPACGTPLVVLRAYDQPFAFSLDSLEDIDIGAELERLAEISERRRRQA